MTINTTLGKYELITDRSNGDQLVFEHQETGESITIDASGDSADLTGIGAMGVERATIDGHLFFSDADTVVDVPGDYSTIQAAIDAQPLNHEHEYVINIANGDYSSEDLIFEGTQNQGTTSTASGGQGNAGENGQVQLLGDQATPSNVKVGSLALFGAVGAAHPQIWGVQFSGDETPHVDESVCVSANGCTEAFLGDCAFVSGSASKAVEAYAGGLHVRDTDFGTDLFTNAIEAKRAATVTVQNNSGTTTGIAYANSDSGGGTWHVYNDSVLGAGNTYEISNGSYRSPEYEQIGGVVDYRLIDDWGDGNLTGRANAAAEGVLPTAHDGRLFNCWYRPDWVTTAGSPTASSGQAELPNGSTIEAQSPEGTSIGQITVGEWEFVIQMASSPSSGTLQFAFIHDNGINQYQVQLEGAGAANVVKDDGGDTTIISSTWGADTNEYVFRVTRDASGNFEFFVDGSSAGTATDSYLPDNPDTTFIFNGMDAQANIKAIRVRPL